MLVIWILSDSAVLPYLASHFSNPAVEQSFSQLSLIKNKFRNRMELTCVKCVLTCQGTESAVINSNHLQGCTLFTADTYSAPAEEDEEESIKTYIQSKQGKFHVCLCLSAE